MLRGSSGSLKRKQTKQKTVFLALEQELDAQVITKDLKAQIQIVRAGTSSAFKALGSIGHLIQSA